MKKILLVCLLTTFITVTSIAHATEIRYYSSLTEFAGIPCSEVNVDDNYIYGSYQSGDLNIWDKSDFSLRTSIYHGDNGVISSFADRDYIYSATLYLYLYIWNREDFSLRVILRGDSSALCGVSADSEQNFRRLSFGFYLCLV
jgi:hypothetical protein